MLSFMFFISTLAFLINTVLYCYYINFMGLLFLIPCCLFTYLARHTNGAEKQVQIVGWELGEGIDLEDPDAPKKVSVVLEDKALNLGFLAIGGPGSGKTVAAIGMLQYFTEKRSGGWVYWEGKGDKDIYQQTVSCGAAPDKFFSSELDHSDTVNVIAGPADSIIERLTQTLIVSESDFYRNAQRDALRAVVPLLKSLDLAVNIRDLYVLLTKEEAAMYVMNLARKKNVDADIIETAQMFLGKDESEKAAEIKGLLNCMSLFVTGKLADRLNSYEPTLDLDHAAKEGQKVYMHLPYTSLAKDIAIMFTEQIGVIAKNRQLYESHREVWPQNYDDWGAFFYGNFGPITARCRSAKMPVSFLFQSRGQTDRVENGNIFTTEITDNIGGMFILRTNGQATAEWASMQFGKYESRELNSSEFHSSISTVEKLRVRGDELKNLDAGEAYLSCLISGKNGQSSNKRYLARFPLPDFSQAADIDWPVIKTGRPNNECEGLHLWRDFMDKDRLKALKEKIIKSVQTQNKIKHESIETTQEIDYI